MGQKDYKSGQRDFKSRQRLQIGARGISNWGQGLQIGTEQRLHNPVKNLRLPNILDVWQGSEYSSEHYILKILKG